MNLPADWWDILQREYPKRYGPQGWIQVRVMVPRALQMGHTWEGILAGTKAYKMYCDDTRITGTEKVQMSKTFYDIRVQGWAEDYAIPEKPKTVADRKSEARWDQLKARAAAIGFRAPTAVESVDVYETTLRQAEREHGSCNQTVASPGPVQKLISDLAKKVAHE